MSTSLALIVIIGLLVCLLLFFIGCLVVLCRRLRCLIDAQIEHEDVQTRFFNAFCIYMSLHKPECFSNDDKI